MKRPFSRERLTNNFAENVKNNCVVQLTTCLNELRAHKKEWISGVSTFHRASTDVDQRVQKLEKKRKDKKRELEQLESKKEAILEKYNLGYDYDSDEAPKELKKIESKFGPNVTV